MLGFTAKERKEIKVINVPIGKIKPNPLQPRKKFDSDSLLGLAESIKQNGILQPLSVRKLDDGNYELVAGERRLRASLLAGKTHVPCIETEIDKNQSAIMALIENLQREDLHFFEESEGIARLIETCGYTQEEVALRLGKNQSTIANKLRLLRLSNDEKFRIINAGLSERHARALLKLADNKREQALDIIIEKNLNVYETEKLVENLLQPIEEKKVHKQLPIVKDIRLFLNTVNNAVDVMKRAGVNAVAENKEYDDYYEYVIKIPKNKNIA